MVKNHRDFAGFDNSNDEFMELCREKYETEEKNCLFIDIFRKKLKLKIVFVMKVDQGHTYNGNQKKLFVRSIKRRFQIVH